MGTLIDTVDDHEGPVRSHSIAFLPLKRTTTICLSAFDVRASQLHQNLSRVRVEPTVIVATRISPKFVEIKAISLPSLFVMFACRNILILNTPKYCRSPIYSMMIQDYIFLELANKEMLT